jgi:hypothetical protein
MFYHMGVHGRLSDRQKVLARRSRTVALCWRLSGDNVPITPRTGTRPDLGPESTGGRPLETMTICHFLIKILEGAIGQMGAGLALNLVRLVGSCDSPHPHHQPRRVSKCRRYLMSVLMRQTLMLPGLACLLQLNGLKGKRSGSGVSDRTERQAPEQNA